MCECQIYGAEDVTAIVCDKEEKEVYFSWLPRGNMKDNNANLIWNITQ